MLPVFLPQSSNSYKKKKTGLHCAVKYQPLVTGKNKENFAVRQLYFSMGHKNLPPPGNRVAQKNGFLFGRF
jgi:hypothetical protein